MPYVLKPSKIFVKNPEGTGFLPQNVIADETAQDIISQIEGAADSIIEEAQQRIAASQDAVDEVETRAQQVISDSHNAVDSIEDQKDAMIASIASIAGQGVDTTLTTPGVAADAEATGNAISDLKSTVSGLMSATADGVEQQLLPSGSSTTRGYWEIADSVASVHSSESGSYFAFPALAVEPGLYTVHMFGNSGHGPSIILGNQVESTDTYTVVSSITYPSGSTGSQQSYNIIIPETGVSHLLLTKYGVHDVSVKHYVQKTDATLLLENVAAESKAVGDKFDDIADQIDDLDELVQSELTETITVQSASIVQGIIETDGTCASNTNFNLRKIDVSALVGKTIKGYTEKHATSSISMCMFAFYDIAYADISRSGATAEHCVGLGNAYTVPSAAQVITEDLVVPQGALTLVISISKQSELDAKIEYSVPLDIKDQLEDIREIINRKLPYQSGKIFFTVDCPRPIPFGEGAYAAQTDETIQCVLRLPTSYTATGTPTRLVLACHGAGGYIMPPDTWYNSNWSNFMNYLVNAGYAVFDANIFGGTDTDVIGKAYGSPLYVQALKKAYDYIQDNYNVYPQIFAHGTSMGGVGAKTFTHFYPKLVLAQSSFAGRDICLYLKTIRSNNYEDDRYYLAYGYASSSALDTDKFSHVVGLSDSLGIMKIVNGAIVYPPDRETDYAGWIDYHSEINRKTQSTYDDDEWIGHTDVPYKSWNAWNDDPYDTAQDVIMANAYAKTNSAPYYAVTYTLTDEEISGTAAHTVMSYGQVRDMRAQLVAWYKRWE